MSAAARFALFAVLTLVAGAAFAQDNKASDDNKILEQSGKNEGTTSAPPPDEDERSLTYSGIGLTKVSSGFDNVKDAINLDFTIIGFRIPTVSWFGIELNGGVTMVPGQVTQTSSTGGTSCSSLNQLLGNCTPSSGSTSQSQSDFQLFTIGAFAVVRSPGKFFGEAKLGYRYLNASLPELENDRSGTSWNAGIGYRWNLRSGSSAELGYTRISKDLHAIGFSIIYGYGRFR